MIRRLFRLAFYLCLTVLALVVAAVLLLNPLAKAVMEMEIRKQTGFEARVGKVDIGLLSPTIRVEDCELRNSVHFGGTPFLQIRELFFEYDPDAICEGKLRIPYLRLNLQEIDRVVDAGGGSNFDDLSKAQKGAVVLKSGFLPIPDAKFAGVERLNLTMNKGRIVVLGHPELCREVRFGVDNQVFTRVNSIGDLETLLVFIDLQSGQSYFTQRIGGLPPFGSSPARPKTPGGK